ncbi:MAG: hypothetical protein GY797_27780 [Deltaproteobacteria bacterium]|nr:hypothetical protein [Deltaproteobacteria bacterium]
MASNLLHELQTKFACTHNIIIKDAWNLFSKFRNNTTGVLRRILFNQNPEVVLSLIDLYTASWKEEKNGYHKGIANALKQANKNSNASSTSFDGRPEDTKDEDFFNARIAIQSLLKCMDMFFLLKHCSDSTENGKVMWQYLKSVFSTLSKGDIIITTNWDTLAERVLLEDCRWSPGDGHGFPVPLKRKLGSQDISELLLENSKVQVLKLHGSYGWQQVKGSPDFYLKYTNYLQYLPLKINGEDIYVADCREPDSYQDGVEPVFIYPSFLKCIEGFQMQSIWYSASEALDNADEIHIIGYSLPESDTAIRTLLNTVRFRLEKGEVKVTVDDPDGEARQRWKDFLGNKAVLRNRSLQ